MWLNNWFNFKIILENSPLVIQPTLVMHAGFLEDRDIKDSYNPGGGKINWGRYIMGVIIIWCSYRFNTPDGKNITALNESLSNQIKVSLGEQTASFNKSTKRDVASLKKDLESMVKREIATVLIEIKKVIQRLKFSNPGTSAINTSTPPNRSPSLSKKDIEAHKEKLK